EPPSGDYGEPFAWLAMNKTSLISAVPLTVESVEALALKADVLVLDRDSGTDRMAARIAAAQPALIVVEISPFGRDAPYPDFRASRLVKLALSGWMHLVGLKGREPLATRGDQLSECFPGAYACLAILACLLRRASTGFGELIAVCETETLMCTNRYFET